MLTYLPERRVLIILSYREPKESQVECELIRPSAIHDHQLSLLKRLGVALSHMMT